LTKGAKIAIGCLVAAVMAVVLFVVGVAALGYWGKRKLETATSDFKRSEEFRQQANAHPFVRPADGVIAEDRLLKFIDVRKAVFAVYEPHRAEIESRGHKKDASLGDMVAFAKLVKDLQAAKAQAQAAAEMSDAEYLFMVESVYRSASASAFQQSSGGKTAEQATRELIEKANREIAAAKNREGLPEEARRALEEQEKDLGSRTEETVREAGTLDAPAENVALFRKYETEIRKYAMTGLEFAGL
jgi:hypothetical protein